MMRRRGTARERVLRIGSVLVLVACMTGCSDGDEAQVPNVIGMTSTQATHRLQQSHLRAHIVVAPGGSVQTLHSSKNIVVSESPTGTVERERTINLVVH